MKIMEKKPACLPAILKKFLMQDILLIHTQKATLTYLRIFIFETYSLPNNDTYVHKTLNINLAFMHMKNTNKISIIIATGKQVDALFIDNQKTQVPLGAEQLTIQGGRTRLCQATSYARNSWMISKIFHLSPLVTVQKIDQRARWGSVDK